MSVVSAVAIYFVIWWLVLFTVLPFGVRNAAEDRVAVPVGQDAGAPIHHGLRRKVMLTTIISAFVFLVLWFISSSGYFGLDDLPFLRSAPSIN